MPLFYIFIFSLFSATLQAQSGFFKTKTDRNIPVYAGLTDKGLQELRQLRDALRQRFRLFDNEFKSLRNVHHAMEVARLFQGNIFLYGPPGGAKSAVVDWMFKGENEGSFQLQLHQMMTEQAFTGGQNFEKAKEGIFEINTKGSLADYPVALIDEVEKGNPSALSALLSLLNERRIMAGSKVVKAKTETVFATSNANLPELNAQFEANGQGSTAPALLNRFQFKCFVYNWLSLEDQADLDDRRERKRQLQALAPECEGASFTDEVFLKPAKVDFTQLRLFANAMMQTDASFKTAYREFADEMRKQTNKAVMESEERHQKSRYDELFVYFPSCDYTERLRQQIPEIVMYSAFIDFLISDLANDETLAKVATKPLTLGVLSLWRAHLVMSTVGPGDVNLVHDQSGKIDLEFSMTIDDSKLRDHREILLLKNLKEEQVRFKSIFLDLVQKTQQSISEASQHSVNVDGSDGSDFEMRIKRN